MENIRNSSNEEKSKNDIQKKLQENMSMSYPWLSAEIGKYLNWEVDLSYIKEEVRILLIDMEIATSPASSREIEQVERETKFMLDILWI